MQVIVIFKIKDCLIDVIIEYLNLLQMLHNFEGYKYDCPDQDVAGHARRIFALKYHPDHEDVFITGGWDNALKVNYFLIL